MNALFASMLFATAAVSAAVAIVGWRRRPAPGSTGLAALGAGLAMWAAALGASWLVTLPDNQVTWLVFVYLGVLTVPAALLALVLDYTDRGDLLTPGGVALLALEPALIMAMIVTDTRLGLFSGAAELSLRTASEGLGAYLNAGYSYAVTLVSVGLLIGYALRQHKEYRPRTNVLLVAIALPLVVDMGQTLLARFPMGFDLTPVAFSLSCALMLFSVHRMGWLDIIPVAHEHLISQMPLGAIVIDGEGRVVDANAAAIALLDVDDHVVGRPAADAFRRWPEAVAALRPSAGRTSIRSAGDSPKYLEIATSAVRDSRGVEVATLVLISDVTEREVSRDALERSERLYRLVSEKIADVVVLVNGEGTFEWVSPSVTAALGWRPEDWVGHRVPEFVYPEDLPIMMETFRSVALGTERLVRHRMLTADGGFRWVEVNPSPYESEEGLAGHQVAVVRVVDTQVSLEQELQRRANYDELTGVFNRHEMLDRIAAALDGDRRSGLLTALMFCDVDELREVNERFGHAGGDALLSAVASRMRSALRQGDVLGRVGGDEFLVVLPGVRSIEDASSVADKVRRFVSKPLPFGDSTISPGISVGVTLVSDSDTMDSLIDRADRGLLQAKNEGRDRVSVMPAP